MKIENYVLPKSSFLSVDKDLSIIVQTILENKRLKKLLYYNTKDCLEKPDLTEEQSLDLIGKNIKIVPKINLDDEIRNYLVINFMDFTNSSNPQFRDSTIMFDILCHFDQWQLKDFQLRPHRIAAELDTILKEKKLTGIGKLQFLGAKKNVIDGGEYAGVCLTYKSVHGKEDEKFMPNPVDEEQFLKDFNEMYNNK